MLYVRMLIRRGKECCAHVAQVYRDEYPVLGVTVWLRG